MAYIEFQEEKQELAALDRPTCRHRRTSPIQPSTLPQSTAKKCPSLRLLKGLFTYRKIMRRTDALKVLFICVCVCHVCPAHPCGENPVDALKTFSRKIGIAPVTMLHYLKINTPSGYKNLMHDYRRYLDCTQMVQNGYFKRSADTTLDRYESLPSKFLQAVMASSSESKHVRSQSPIAAEEARNNVLIMGNTGKGDNYQFAEEYTDKGDKFGSDEAPYKRSDYSKLAEAIRMTNKHHKHQKHSNDRHLKSNDVIHSRLLTLLKRSLESNENTEWASMGA